MKSLATVTAALVVVACAADARAQTGVSDDRVSLPDGPGSVGGVGESATVDPNMGHMAHSVVIAVPTGHAGLTPHLALTYSSGAGTGPVGFGWSMDLGSVERLTKRGLPRYTTNDELTATGSGELVRLPGTNVYRARFEGGFIRWTWHGAPDGREGYWTAEHPDGRVATYGAESDGTLVADARVGGLEGTFRWMLVSMRDRLGHEIRYTYTKFGNVSLPLQVGWAHVGGQALHEVTFAWEDRQDEVSDARGGFEELLEKRLKTVFVRVGGQLLRKYELDYEDYASSGGFSRLVAVRRFGTDGGEHPVVQAFTYSRALGADGAGSDAAQKPYVVDMGGPGVPLSSGQATLIDINGDALPDVLDAGSAEATHRFFVNTLAADGGHAFAPGFYSQTLTKLGSHVLGTASVQVLDVDGDGFADLLNAKTGEVLVNRGAGDWEAQTLSLWDTGGDGGLDSALESDFDPNEGLATLRFLDWNGDRRIDLVRSTGSGDANQTTYFQNTGVGVFEVFEDPGAMPLGAGFESDRLELSDMNGDGLLDLVEVLPSSVRYKLNLGWGRWQPASPTEWVEIAGFSFTDQEATEAALEDLNGDGLSDLVVVAGSEVRYWLNRNGASFDPERVITSADVTGELPSKEAQTVVLFADMNGNGSTDVVWIDGGGDLSYLELFPVRPNLLSRIENGLGRVVDVVYGSSVAQMAEDGGPGAWAHPLPHAMMVVESLNERDLLTNVGNLTEYVYHDGFYDGVEKEFRGYERVEERAPGDAFQEEGLTLTVYDVGRTDPYAFGRLVQREVRSDGEVLEVASWEHADCPVAGIPAAGLVYPVRHVCQVAEEVEQRERLADASQWVTLRKETTWDGYGNPVLAADLGIVKVGGGACEPCATSGYTGWPCGPSCLGDESYRATEYADPADNDDAWIPRLPVRERTFGVASAAEAPATDQVAERLYYYDGAPFVGLPLGQVGAGLISRVTDRLDANGAVTESLRHAYDGFGNVVEQLGPGGAVEGSTHRRRFTYDATGRFLLETELDVDGPDGVWQLRQRSEWDELAGLVTAATGFITVVDGEEVDPPNPTGYLHDEHGQPVAVVKPGASAAAPSQTFAWEYGSPVTRLVSRVRSATDAAPDVETALCYDGHGRVFQRRRRLAEGKWLVDGFLVFNAQGAPQAIYEPYEASSGECDLAPPQGVHASTVHRDARGRVVRRQLRPMPGLDEPRLETVYLPAALVSWDAEDLREGGLHSGTPTTRRFNGRDQLLAIERTAAPGAAPAVHTLRYDELGHLAEAEDPIGAVRKQTYDLAGRVLGLSDPDHGDWAYELDAAGNLIRETTPTGAVLEYAYDSLDRRVARWDAAAPVNTETRWHWDRAPDCPATLCSNAAGRLATVRAAVGDGTETALRFGYDTRGMVHTMVRHLHGFDYVHETEWDHAGRTTSVTFPSGLSVDFELDAAGRVTSVPGFVDAIGYHPRGLLASLQLANGVVATRAYDASDRVERLQVTGPDDATLLDLELAWDGANNLLEVLDLRPEDGQPHAGGQFAYDSLYQLAEARLDPGRPAHDETLTYAVDAASRILSITSSLGASSPAHVGTLTYGTTAERPHAVLQAGALTYAHDAAGAVVQRGAASYERDALGRVVRVTEGGSEVAWLGYADTWHRLLKHEAGRFFAYALPGFDVRDGTATSSIEVGGLRVATVDEPAFAATVYSDLAPASGPDEALAPAPDGAITAGDAWLSLAHGAGHLSLAAGTRVTAPEPLLSAALDRLLGGDAWAAPRTTFLHQDHLGSVLATTDEDGALVARAAHYPYGLQRHAAGEQPLRGYSDEERDAATGLLAYGARDLDPWVGRWMSPDPLLKGLTPPTTERLEETLSAYAMVLSNPMGAVDQGGQVLDPATGAVVGAVVGGVKAAIERQMEMPEGVYLFAKGHRKRTIAAIAIGAGAGAGMGALTCGLSAYGEAGGMVARGLIRWAKKDGRNGSSGMLHEKLGDQGAEWLTDVVIGLAEGAATGNAAAFALVAVDTGIKAMHVAELTRSRGRTNLSESLQDVFLDGALGEESFAGTPRVRTVRQRAKHWHAMRQRVKSMKTAPAPGTKAKP